MTSTDERFRPVNAYTGPDGALYIVDIARGVIQHKGFLTYYLVKNIQDRKLETPFNLGRIYRIVPDGAKPKLVKLPDGNRADSRDARRMPTAGCATPRSGCSSSAAMPRWCPRCKKIAATGADAAGARAGALDAGRLERAHARGDHRGLARQGRESARGGGASGRSVAGLPNWSSWATTRARKCGCTSPSN